MDKLIITPGKVRGLGNLLTSKQVEDLILYNSEVSIASDGTFIMDYAQSNLIVSNYETAILNGETSSVTVRVLDDNQAPVPGVTVTLFDGSTSISNETTNNNGYATIDYTLSTDGSHFLHVEGNNLKSKRWEVIVSTVTSIILTTNTTEIWKGSEATFTASVLDANNVGIANVPVDFVFIDNETELENIIVNTNEEGIATTSYQGQYYTNGNLLCTATCGEESGSVLLLERYKYYENGILEGTGITLFNILTPPSFDANGNMQIPTNQRTGSTIYWGVTLPEQFNIQWKYNGTITGFTGLNFGLATDENTFEWCADSIVQYNNSNFTVLGKTFAGTLQSGDVFNYNFNGASLQISQIRGNNPVWTMKTDFDFEDCLFGLDVSQYNGYKFNDLIATYYYRAETATSVSLDLSAVNINQGSPVTLTGTSEAYGVISFYEGNTLLATKVANSSGVATYTYTPQNDGSLTIKAECNESTAQKTLNVLAPGSLTCSSNKSVVVKNNSITLSSTVRSTTSVVLAGVDVDFYSGSTKIGTATTDSNGVAIYNYTPTTAGTISLTAKTGNITSSAVSVRVKNNNTPSTITAVADSTSVYVGEWCNIVVTVKDAENDVCANAELNVSLNGTWQSVTVTTNSEGKYTHSLPSSSPTTLTFAFRSASYNSVLSNTVTINWVNPVSYDDVVLSADKSVLSYSDGDTCTLSAQLMDGGSAAAVSGVTVEFFKDSVSLGTSQTNSSGVATKVYSSTGSGDVSFTAEVGSIVSEIYSIHDYIKYSSDGTGLAGTYNTGTDGTYDYITHLESILDPETSLTNSCEVSYKFKVTSSSGTGYGSLLWCIGSDANNGVLIGTESNSNRMRIYSRSNGNNTVQQTTNNVWSLNTWFDVKITYNNGTISITVGGQTISYSLASVAYFKTYTPASYDVELSQFIVKPL